MSDITAGPADGGAGMLGNEVPESVSISWGGKGSATFRLPKPRGWSPVQCEQKDKSTIQQGPEAETDSRSRGARIRQVEKGKNSFSPFLISAHL